MIILMKYVLILKWLFYGVFYGILEECKEWDRKLIRG